MSKTQPAATKNAQRVRFSSATGTTLTVQLRPGKRGFNVSAALKTKGQKTRTGARNAFAHLADAQKAFDALVQEAKQRGWSERAKGIKGVGAFDRIPQADETPRTE